MNSRDSFRKISEDARRIRLESEASLARQQATVVKPSRQPEPAIDKVLGVLCHPFMVATWIAVAVAVAVWI